MSRYEALRELGCDHITAAGLSFLNWAMQVPRNEIRCLFLTIEYDQDLKP